MSSFDRSELRSVVKERYCDGAGSCLRCQLRDDIEEQNGDDKPLQPPFQLWYVDIVPRDLARQCGWARRSTFRAARRLARFGRLGVVVEQRWPWRGLREDRLVTIVQLEGVWYAVPIQSETRSGKANA